MSEDNRKRPCILRVLPTVNARVRAYATRQGLAPNVAAEALINGAAGEIAALDAEVERLKAQAPPSADAFDKAIADRNAAERQNDTLRAELESAREATRRADQALESSHRSNRILAGRADAAEAEVARLTREVASFRGGLDLAAETIARLTADLATAGEELEAERRRDEAAHDALRAEVERLDRELTISEENTAAAVRLVERREKELAGERLKTEAAQARRSSAAPCACALPDDLAARVKARIAARPGRDFAFVVKNGCDRLEGSDRYVDKKKAEREEANDA